MTSTYNKDLKNNDELKKQLIMLVRHDNLSVAGAARALGLSERTAQSFYNAETHWAFMWWQDNGEIVDKYFDGFSDLSEPEHLIGCRPTYKSGKEDEKLMEEIARGRETSFRTDYKLVVGNESKVYKVDNSRVLLLSDLHVPYHHKDAIKFLQHLKDKYNPTRVICLGDEVDHLALSYHEKETEAPSAFDELKLALPIIKQIEEMFPVMDILDSNHGSLAYRKAKTAGIPKHYLKSYADVLQVGDGWKWHFDMVIDLPTGQKCYLHHGKSSNITKTSQAMSMCSVAGHYHNTFKIEYWANPLGLYWGMQAGCLIDDKSFAFNYNNVNLHRPLIGTGLIIDGLPVLEPMVLNESGDWVGK